MRSIIIHPTYFPSVSHYVAMVQADAVIFETDDNFQKQTNRNRMYIYSPNGIQLLNVPVKHTINAHQKTRDVKIEWAFNWQKQHFKSFEAAYRSSPFFEYYEDELLPVFEKKPTYLLDLNFHIFDVVNRCLGIEIPFTETKEFHHKINEGMDVRGLVNGKKDTSQFEAYTQVFGEKHGYLNNLSILDLLCNEGRYSLDYLKNQSFSLPQD